MLWLDPTTGRAAALVVVNVAFPSILGNAGVVRRNLSHDCPPQSGLREDYASPVEQSSDSACWQWTVGLRGAANPAVVRSTQNGRLV
jgi:hypothetical protein